MSDNIDDDLGSDKPAAKGPHSKLRRAARLAAVQALYQLDVGEETSVSVVGEFKEHRLGGEPTDEAFFEDIVEGVVRNQASIDKAVAANLSEKWSLKRIELTLRAILRAATYEIHHRPDVPALVIIDQYVSITADFSQGKEPGFINGALDKIAKDVRKAEFALVGHG